MEKEQGWLDKREECMEVDLLPWMDGNSVRTRNRVTRATKLREGWLVRREEPKELDWILENKEDLVVEMEQGETAEEC